MRKYLINILFYVINFLFLFGLQHFGSSLGYIHMIDAIIKFIFFVYQAFVASDMIGEGKASKLYVSYAILITYFIFKLDFDYYNLYVR